jgi:voltage-dependent calcium channel T type alpha-1G
MFKGKLFHCVGPDLVNITTKNECLTNSRNQWMNERYNFDHIFNALITLFIFATKDGWVNIMYMGIDAVDVDMQPIKNYNEWMILYFISNLLIIGFFVINMFVGVVVDNFQKCRVAQQLDENKYNEEKLMKKRQKKVKSMKKLYLILEKSQSNSVSSFGIRMKSRLPLKKDVGLFS